MAWYENARIFYDWVDYGKDLDLEYTEWVVQKALNVHADTLAFCAVNGGYALWNSKVTKKYARMGEMDFIGEMARLCRENDLYFVPWWLATATGGTRQILEQHPSWQEVGPPRDGQPGERYNYVCYNSPYRELVFEEVREVITNYDVDGIYFDQLPVSCYCPWCEAKFERRYNEPLPVVEDEFLIYDSPAGFPPKLKAFRDDSVRSFAAGIREIIEDVNPEICYAQNWVKNWQSRLVRGLADVVLPEFYQRKDLVPLGLKHRLTKTYFDHGTIWGNVRHSVRHDARHFPVRSTKMLLVDCVANHAVPLMLDLCAMDFDPTGTEELAATFDHIKAIQDIQAQSEPLRYAALLHSMPSHEHDAGRYEEAIEGIYRLLVESHVPFEIVNEAGIQRGELQDYKVLILADAMALADESVTAIQSAVESGMGLVGTFMTGFFDDSGKRRVQPALADLFGYVVDDITAFDTREGLFTDPVLGIEDLDGEIFHYGSARTDHALAENLPQGGLFSFRGGYVICEPSEGVEIFSDIHAMDHVRLSAKHYNRRGHYPGPARWPLGIARKLDQARLVYFAPQAEAEWRRAHAPELDQLLIRAVSWVGGPLPIVATDCPQSVEVRLFHNENANIYHLILINLTTNPLLKSDPFNPGVVRFVTPQKGLQLVLRINGTTKTVKSLIGGEISHRQEGHEVIIDVPVLDLYESIVVECRD